MHHHHHIFHRDHPAENAQRTPTSGLNASEQVLQSEEYTAVINWLSGRTKSVGDALDIFCQPVENKFFQTENAQNVEPLLWRAWQAIVGEAATTPHTSQHKQKLVELMLNLAFRPTLSRGESICEVDGMKVWRDLPIFGWELREAWNFAASGSSDQKSREQWTNVNGFTASLVSALHSKAQDRPDYSLFGLWTLRAALEEPGEIPNVAVAAAAVWLIYAAPALRAFSNQEKSFEGKVAKPGSSFGPEEWRGFSQARWTAWSNNLRDVHMAVSDQPTAGLVKQAVQAMEDAEKQ
ncbi:uncharacterized protein LTR77_004926 [Saxophila tyrrhenica]|uniref:Uncharacterized protein n=1 Tax=Saxophila tyrrhenica TaxID=1690608 RepID=A0AAV9PAG3_9PEZI|nr:hypothetical protein LTR77_004926 [Saxophila tyrrhenica]